MTRKVQIAILILLMVIGTSLRTYGLGRVVPWYDEGLTLLHLSGCTVNHCIEKEQRAASSGPATWHQLLSRYQSPAQSIDLVAHAVVTDQPEHPPLFFQVLYLWAKAFGHKLYVLRAVPIIFGVLCLPAFYWFAMELFRSPYPSLLATAMLCLSPMHICFSQDLRDYSLFSLMLSLSCAAFLKVWRKNRLQDWALYTAISTAGICSTYLMILVLAGQLLFSTCAAAIKWLNEERFARFTITQWIVHILSIGITLAVCSPLLLTVVSRWQAVRRTVDCFERLCDPHVLINTLLFPPVLCWTFRPTFFIFRDQEAAALNEHLWIHIPLLLLVLYSILQMLGSHRRQCLFLLSIILIFMIVVWIPDVIMGGQRSTAMRFLQPVPMFALLPASLTLCQWWQTGRALRILSALVFAVLFACQIQAFQFLLECNEHGLGRCRLTTVAHAINSDKDAVVLADLETYKRGFPHLLALAHQIDDKSRAVACINDFVPAWMDRFDHAYVVYYTSANSKKYSRFKVKSASPNNIYCHCALIETNGPKCSERSPVR